MAPSADVVPKPRLCPLCRAAIAEAVVELGIVHVRVCKGCSSKAYYAMKAAAFLRGLLGEP